MDQLPEDLACLGPRLLSVRAALDDQAVAAHSTQLHAQGPAVQAQSVLGHTAKTAAAVSAPPCPRDGMAQVSS